MSLSDVAVSLLAGAVVLNGVVIIWHTRQIRQLFTWHAEANDWTLIAPETAAEQTPDGPGDDEWDQGTYP